MTNSKTAKSRIASGIVLALILSAPGVEPYRLAASVVGKVPGNLGNPGLGSSAAGGVGGTNYVNPVIKPGTQLDLGLKVTLPSVGSVNMKADDTTPKAARKAAVSASVAPSHQVAHQHSVKGAAVSPTANIEARGPPTGNQKGAVKPSAREILQAGVGRMKEAATPLGRFSTLKALFSGSRKSKTDADFSPEPVASIGELETQAEKQYRDLAAGGDYKNAAVLGRLRKTIAAIEDRGGEKAVESLNRLKDKISSRSATDVVREGIARTIEDIQAQSEAAEETVADGKGGNDAPTKSSSKKFFTAAIASYIGGLALAQIGQEFLGQSMPQLIKETFGNFNIYASVMVFAMIGRVFGTALGGILPDRYGLKKTFIGGEAGRAVTMSILVTLLIMGQMTIPLYFTLSAINGFFTGITITASRSIPIALFKGDQPLMEKFFGWYQFLVEFVGIGAPLIAGYIIATTGTFAFTIGAFPVILISAIVFFMIYLKVPDVRTKQAKKPGSEEAPAKKGVFAQFGSVLKDVWKKVTEGARITLRKPALRIAALSDAGFHMLNGFLYAVIAPAFGLYIMGVPTLAASVQAWVVGSYSLGSMIGSVIMLLQGRKLEKERAGWQVSDKELKKRMRKSTLNWMGLGAISLLLFLPMIGTATLPVYIAMGFFGLLSVVPTLKLQSLAGSLTPQKDIAKVQGFIQMASSLMIAGNIWLLSNVFDIFVNAADVPTSTAFVVLNLALGGLAVGFLIARSYLKKTLNTPVRRSYRSGTRAALPRGLGWLRHIVPQFILRKFVISSAEKKEWAKLDKNLKRLGIDSYKKITVKGKADHDRPTVVFLAPPSAHKLPIMQEGGRQSPGDVHLAFDPSWLISEETSDGKTILFLKKGLYFDKDGKAVVAEYETPRRVRYFANFFTAGANERTDGNAYEKNLDVPQSSSLQLEKTTNDKLLTRLWMAAKGVAVPATLAFLLAAHPLNAGASAADASANGVTVAALPSASDQAPDRREEIHASVEKFLSENAATLGEEVVVKPSGPQWHSSKGVEFFGSKDVEGIVAHVLALERDPEMTSDGSILIDQRVVSPALYYTSTPLSGDGQKKDHDTWGNRVDGNVGIDFLSADSIAAGAPAGTKKDFSLGVYAMRTPWGRAKAADIMVRAGPWGKPTVSEPGGPNANWRDHIEDAATIFRYENVIEMIRQQHGLLKTDEEAEAFTKKIKATAEAALEAIWEKEELLPREEGASYQAKTDFVRLDIMIDFRDGELVPIVIEVNDHDSGGQIQIDELYPEHKGTHSREWVATMLDRARRDALKGKKIVIVGAGYEGKRFIFEEAKELGVKVVLIDNPGSWAADIVDEYIEVDLFGLHSEDAADKAMAELEKRGLLAEIDGITSFWEDDIPTAAKVGEKLNLPYISYRAARIARNKSATRGLMAKAGLPSPRFAYLKSSKDLAGAVDKVGFPAVLKPASGAEAKSVYEVNNEVELRLAYARALQQVAEIAEEDGAFSTEAGFLLEEYLDGPEVDIDVIMRDGEPVYDSVTDNWPTQRPYFLATGSSLPSRLSDGDRKALVKLAVDAAKAIGLKNGNFHIEAKMTSRGPRLIEANARMGGTYVHIWNEAVWGVDLVKEGFMAAASIPGPVFQSQTPRTFLEGRFIIPEVSGKLTKLDIDESIFDDGQGLFNLRKYKKVGDDIAVPPHGVDRVALLVAKGRSAAEAQGRLAVLSAKVEVEVQPEVEVGSDEWLSRKIETSPRGMKFAQFAKTEYKDEYAVKLKEMGVDVVSIRNPSREEIVSREEGAGWYLQPRWVRWVRPAQTIEEFLGDLKAKKRRFYRKLMEENAHIPAEIKPLTPEDYEEWHPLYVEHVVGKAGGRMHVKKDWARKLQEDGKLEGWYGVFFRHPETGEMVGGMLIAGRPEIKALSMGFAAFDGYAKQHNLSYKSYLMSLEKAKELGFKYASAGADTNFYGYDYDLGLLAWKAAIRMVPHPEEPFNLIKVLDPSKFAEGKDEGKRAGHFFFSIKREGAFYERFLDRADEMTGEEGEGFELIGSAFLEDAIAKPEEMMVGNQFYFDDIVTPAPQQVETIRRKI